MSTRFRTFAPLLLRLLAIAVAFAAGTFAPAASAQKFQPGSNYICPNNADSGLDCYLVPSATCTRCAATSKSIEVIEFGYEKAQQGVNGAKSEYCIDKQKINITRPYQAALSEVTPSKDAINGLRTLQQLWLEALAGLKWKSGETDDDYQNRVSPLCRVHQNGRSHPHRGSNRAEGSRRRGRQVQARLECPLSAH